MDPPPTPDPAQLPLDPLDESRSPEENRAHQRRTESQADAGAGPLVPNQPLHSGPRPALPRESSVAENQEMAVRLAAYPAQGSGSWQLASLEEEGAGTAAGCGGR